MPVYTKLFIAFFLVIFFDYYLVLKKFDVKKHLATRLSNVLLLLASLVFYAWAGIIFVPVIIIFGFVTYASGLVLERLDNSVHRKLAASLFVAAELLPLVIVRILGLASRYSGYDEFIVPLGLSFFSLQVVTYTVGVYQRKIPAEKDLLTILLFVSFFPCVSSGPIQRAENLIPQIKKEKLFDYERSVEGLILMVWGLIKSWCLRIIWHFILIL